MTERPAFLSQVAFGPLRLGAPILDFRFPRPD